MGGRPVQYSNSLASAAFRLQTGECPRLWLLYPGAGPNRRSIFLGRKWQLRMLGSTLGYAGAPAAAAQPHSSEVFGAEVHRGHHAPSPLLPRWIAMHRGWWQDVAGLPWPAQREVATGTQLRVGIGTESDTSSPEVPKQGEAEEEATGGDRGPVCGSAPPGMLHCTAACLATRVPLYTLPNCRAQGTWRCF